MNAIPQSHQAIDFDRLIKGYGLAQTALLGGSCCNGKGVQRNEDDKLYARASFCFCSPPPWRLGLRRAADVVLGRDVYLIFVIFSLWRAKRVLQPNADTRHQAGSVYFHVRARLFRFARTFYGDIYSNTRDRSHTHRWQR